MNTLVIVAVLFFTLAEHVYSQTTSSTLISAKCRGGVLMARPDWQSEILTKISPNETVFVFRDFYENDYYKVRYKAFDGYLTWHVLHPNEELSAFTDSITTVIVNREARQEILDRIKEDEKAKEKAKKWREHVLNKYGSEKGSRILRNEYWIGMTSTEALDSLGPPERINRTTGVYGAQEQWVYNGAYLYFENGVLRSFQEYPTN